MKIEVISSINLEGYNKFAKQNYSKFVEFWPNDIHLYVYSEDDITDIISNITFKNLYKFQPSCKTFVNTNKNKKWKPPYSQKLYKQLHIKFCYKVYALCYHALNSDADFVIWLDADIETKKKFDIRNFDFFRNDVFCCYLGRENCTRNISPTNSVSTETGLIIFNNKHKISKQFFQQYQNLYDTNEIFNLDEIHDGYVFDIVKKKFSKKHFASFIKDSDQDFPLENFVLKDYLHHRLGKKKWTG